MATYYWSKNRFEKIIIYKLSTSHLKQHLGEEDVEKFEKTNDRLIRCSGCAVITHWQSEPLPLSNATEVKVWGNLKAVAAYPQRPSMCINKCLSFHVAMLSPGKSINANIARRTAHCPKTDQAHQNGSK